MSPTSDDDIRVRPLVGEDSAWARGLIVERWAATVIVSRGVSHDAADAEGFVAIKGRERVGLATFRTEGGDCELLTLDATRPREGVGSLLLARVAAQARDRGCRRVWLITSNDNLDALRFYLRSGCRLVAVHRGGVDAARSLKPQIPLIGAHGIPIHDELELELDLEPKG